MNPITHGLGWTTADYALIISLFSAALAVAGFVWNIWSKFIFPKPKIQLRATACFFHKNSETIRYFSSERAYLESDIRLALSLPALHLVAVNHGPGEVKLRDVFFTDGGYFHTRKSGLHLMAAFEDYPEHSSSGKWKHERMENKIGPTEEVELYFPGRAIFDARAKRLGFNDTFKRVHWTTRNEVNIAQAILRLHFNHT